MTVTATFSTPVEVANVNDPTNNNVAPTVSTDGSELFLSSNRVGNQYRIYHATSSGSAFSTATEVTELTGVDGGGRGLETPVLSDDGLTLYFSVVANADGSGFAFTVWMAQRATVNDPFGNLQAVTEINADSPFSAPAWLSNDACRLYVSQTRADGGTTFNLYVYRR
jgi:Tol biopolymer transport system component